MIPAAAGPDVSPLGVAASLLLIAIAIALSAKERLGLERSIAWSATRAAVQLLAIGSAIHLSALRMLYQAVLAPA